MNIFKKSLAVGISVVSMSLTSAAIANQPYENNMGQSAQLTHTMQNQYRNIDHKDLSSSGSRHEKTRLSREENITEKSRERNTLGQSDALSKMQPYVSRTKHRSNNLATN